VNLESSLSAFPNLQREWNSLRRETDAELRDEGTLSIARRLETQGGNELAAAIYQELSRRPGLTQARAGAALDALQGRGELGARAELWFRDFSASVTDPASLLAMGVAGSVFRAARFTALANLRSAGFSGNFARWGAGLAGLSLEAPAFTLSARFGSELLGRPQSWSAEALGRDLSAGYLMLGGLRGVGALGQRTLRTLPLSLQASPLLNFTIGQGSLLGGILAAHSLETAVGLRQRQSGGSALFEGLATLIHFRVAGRLSRAAFGENFAAWERRLDQRSERLAERGPVNGGDGPFAWGSQVELALANVGGAPPRRGSPHSSTISQMSANDGSGKGSRPSQSGTRPAVNMDSSDAAATAFLQGIGNSESGLRAFLNTLPVAATVSRTHGEDGMFRIFAANSNFLRQFGYHERELAERPLAEYCSLREAPVTPARLWTMMRGGVFKAAAVDFEGRRGLQKSWVSGVVRNIYGEELAFTFYEPRAEGEYEAPPVRPELKAFQNVDGARRLQLNASGYHELRSVLELSLQLTNPDSPLLRSLRHNDLRLLIQSEDAALPEIVPQLERSLSHWAQRWNLPPGRSLLIEQETRSGTENHSLPLVSGPFGFSNVKDRASFSAVAAPTPSALKTPVRPGGLLEEVRKALGVVGDRKDNKD
jgi:PAS domain-containing protein